MSIARQLCVACLAALCAVTSLPNAFAQKGINQVQIKGSDTMVNMSAALAEAFMAKNSGIDVAVTGGGSGVGISALLNGTTDICNASRDIKPEEKQKGAENGVNCVETNVALDGIAIAVNPSNPLTEISQEQLKRIYTGEVKNWKEINGVDGDIVLLSRETSSGTYVFFQEHVLEKQDYTPRAKLMPATSAIIESVANDKTAIGYVGLGYAAKAKDRVKVLKVKAKPDSAAIEATEATVRSGEYPIARPLHCYTNGKPKGAAKALLEFTLSPEGQAIVAEQGYVPLK